MPEGALQPAPVRTNRRPCRSRKSRSGARASCIAPSLHDARAGGRGASAALRQYLTEQPYDGELAVVTALPAIASSSAAATKFLAVGRSAWSVEGLSSMPPAWTSVACAATTSLCGGGFAPYARPTAPSVSMRYAVGDAPFSFISALILSAGKLPSFPGAEEFTDSQATPLPVYVFWRRCMLPLP